MEFETKNKKLSAQFLTEPQESIILFNSNNKNLIKEKSEFEQIIQSPTMEKNTNGFSSENVLKEHLVSIDCKELNIKDALYIENKNATLSAKEETEPQESVILFNSKHKSCKKGKSETRKHTTINHVNEKDQFDAGL